MAISEVLWFVGHVKDGELEMIPHLSQLEVFMNTEHHPAKFYKHLKIFLKNKVSLHKFII